MKTSKEQLYSVRQMNLEACTGQGHIWIQEADAKDVPEYSAHSVETHKRQQIRNKPN